MPDLDALAAATTVELTDAFRRLANDPPPPSDVLARYFGATPAGRVLLALLLDPERGRYALATLATEPSVASAVRPMLANDVSLAAPPVPAPPGAEAVLARRYAAAVAELAGRAGVAVPTGTPDEVEAVLRERVVFAPGLLSLATRRVVEVTPAGGPAPGDLDVLCPEMQRVLDAATLADVPAVGATAGWPGRRGALLARHVDVDPLPDRVTFSPATPHDLAAYRCAEHDDYVLVAR